MPEVAATAAAPRSPNPGPAPWRHSASRARLLAISLWMVIGCSEDAADTPDKCAGKVACTPCQDASDASLVGGDGAVTGDADSVSPQCPTAPVGAVLASPVGLGDVIDCDLMDISPTAQRELWSCRIAVPSNAGGVLLMRDEVGATSLPSASTEVFVLDMGGPATWLGEDAFQCGWGHCLRITSGGVVWRTSYGTELPSNHLGSIRLTAGGQLLVPGAIRFPHASGRSGGASPRFYPKGKPATGLVAGGALAAHDGELLHEWEAPSQIAAKEAAGLRTHLRWTWVEPLADGGTLWVGRSLQFVANPNSHCLVAGAAKDVKDWRWFGLLDPTLPCAGDNESIGVSAAGVVVPSPETAIVHAADLQPAAGSHEEWRSQLIAVDVATGQVRWRRDVAGRASVTRFVGDGGLADPTDVRVGALALGPGGRITMGRVPVPEHYISKHGGGDVTDRAMEVLTFDIYGNELWRWKSARLLGDNMLGPGSIRVSACGVEAIWRKTWFHLDPWGHDTAASAGVCASKAVSDCLDTNPCTKDHCDPVLGCTHTPHADGAGCRDDGATCKAGVCVGP